MMKIIIITQDDFFFIPLFFKELLKQGNLKKYHIEMIAILKPFNENYLALAKRMYNFYGPFDFLRQGYKYVIIKGLDKLHLNRNSIRKIVSEYGITVKDVINVNDPSFILELESKKPDIILSVAASQIFRKDILNLPILGCINIHSGPLPKYRGMMPNFWTLYNNEKYAWVTIHKMVEKLDDGPIILQEKFEILPDETYNSLAKRSKEFAARLLIKTLEQFEDGRVNYLPNDSLKATYYTFPTKEEIREFKRRGGRII